MLERQTKSWNRSTEELAVACRLLEKSGLLDRDAYRAAAGLRPGATVSKHYLTKGWRLGLEPGPNFNGAFLHMYFSSAGFDGPPALTYLTLKSSDWTAYPTRKEAEAAARIVRDSGLFNAEEYSARVGLPRHLDPALHYVIVGEQMGQAPSDRFDPAYYREKYGRKANSDGSLLIEYVTGGRAAGRRPVSVASTLAFDTSRLDPLRETVLMIGHQASRTGAPILAYNVASILSRRYNVVVLLLAGGELVEDFKTCASAVVGPIDRADWHPADTKRIVERIMASCEISYAIANTIDSRMMLKPLSLAFIPVLALVHEFPIHLPREGQMGRALEWATQTVFSSKSVADAACTDYPPLRNLSIHTLRQGRSILPPAPSSELTEKAEQSLREAFGPRGAENALVVFGCGTINYRKGVDLFVSCAAAVAALKPKRGVRFVWIGQTLPQDMDRGYSFFLQQQISRSGLQDTVAIIGEVPNLDSAYDAADVFFLSSRLDPLPNVAIDAASRGLPIVCFEQSGGMAECMQSDPMCSQGVVPYMDVNAAAQVIARLADDDNARKTFGEALRQLAKTTFDMERYVERLDELGREAMVTMRQRAEDCEVIRSGTNLDLTNMLGPDPEPLKREEAIRVFVARAALLRAESPRNFYYRRPLPGFHPQIYAHENAAICGPSVNPLAHFIRSGRPAGPWCHQVITPGPDAMPAVVELRVAIHVHFHYPELASDFLRRLHFNGSRCDLFLSTNDDIKADLLREEVADYDRGSSSVRIVPNRGRDIGPFLTEFAEEIVDSGYDVVGHLHGKRSLHVADPMLGERWREFALQHLLGRLYPMMDVVLDRFAVDEALGIVFPEDPHLSGWDLNLEMAADLARRMGINDALPPFFDFPIGTMFWARPQALKPLFDLGFKWEDYPEEPVPIDGTLLHAVERLLPFAARHGGYRYATTYIPGVTW